MKTITQVITELSEIRAEHGDIEVVGVNDEEISFEVQDDVDGGPSVVVAE